MIKRILGVSLFLISGAGWAESTICKVDDTGGIGVQGIAWDTESKSAKVTDSFGETFSATVVSTREHDKGYKVNLIAKDHLAMDEIEIIVFPVSGGHRILAAGFEFIEERRLLSAILDGGDATCVTM